MVGAGRCRGRVQTAGAGPALGVWRPVNEAVKKCKEGWWAAGMQSLHARRFPCIEAQAPSAYPRCAGLVPRSPRACYEREGVPPDQQYSKFPEPGEQGVKCYQSWEAGAPEADCR